MKMRSVSGFTLIELIVVIAILAILAATAVPRFIDLRGEAVAATAQGVAGAISSGTAVNYAGRVAGNAAATAIATCTDSLRVFPAGGTPAASFLAATAVANGAAAACIFSYTSGGISTIATATVIGAT